MAEARMPYYKSLDGMRAYCILLVIYDHLKSNGHTLPWLNGHLGVDLFFLISGFLITTLLTREQVLTGRVDLRAFYWRRFFRIAPVYFAVLGLYLLATHLPHQQLKWQQLKHALPWFLTMLNEFAPGSVFTHTWSLGVEEKFYLFWPLLAFAVTHALRSRVIVLSGLVAITGVAALLGHGYLARAYFGLLVGCALGILLHFSTLTSDTSFSLLAANRPATRLTQSLRKIPPLGVVFLFALGFYAEHVSKALFPIFSLFSALLIAHLILEETWLTRLHEASPLRWFGRRSYAMYLVHILCLNAIEVRIQITSAWRALFAFLVAVALTAGVAEFLYRAIEKPARDFGRAWIARRPERPAVV